MNYYEPFSNFEKVEGKCYIKDRKDGGKFTVVTIQAPTGEKYKGTALILPEDMNYYRPLTGYKIAENRAYISYLKLRVLRLRILKNDIECALLQNKVSKGLSNRELRDMGHTVIELKKQIVIGQTSIKNAYKLMNSIIEERWKIDDKLKARAEKNQERQAIVDAIRAGQNS